MSAYAIGRVLFLLTAALVTSLVSVADADRPATASSTGTRPGIAAKYFAAPMAFEANRGQTDPRVDFVARGSGYAVFLTETDAVLALKAASSSSADRETVVRMHLARRTATARAEAVDQLPGRSHYFIGDDPGRWRTEVPTYAKVRYRDIYPGIDIIYYGHQRQLEYDLVVRPGADPRAIALAFDGAERLEVDEHGDLIVHAGDQRIVQHAPVVYQDVAGARRSIAARYVLNAAREVGVVVGAYDRRYALVIDPVLSYLTYLGGADFDGGLAIAVDAAGNAYVGGQTASIDFPGTTGGLQPTNGGTRDAFVVKLNAAGSGLVFSTYLGGSGFDRVLGIALDAANNVLLAGLTRSANFPTTPGAFATTLTGLGGAFVTKLNASGSALVYSTYLPGADRITGLAVDSASNAYVVGNTVDPSFPVSAGAFQTTPGGNIDGFVAKLNASGSALVYSTRIGGSDSDDALGVAVDSSGSAYVTGVTASPNFPTTPGAFQTTIAGSADAFVMKLNPSGSALVYSTLLGGTVRDIAFSIAIDAAGNAYVAGQTESTDFPTTTGAFQTTRGGTDPGASDAFVTKVNAAGTALVYSTYLGGVASDFATAIAVDGAGQAYVTGSTLSSNFPTVNPLQSPGLNNSAFISVLNAAGSALDFSTALTGTGVTDGAAIALDAAGNIYATGQSNAPNLPTTPGAFQTTRAGLTDAYVVKLLNRDGTVGAAGGTVADTAGTGASFTVPAGVLASNIDVSITVLVNPGVAPPPGFVGNATVFVAITLTPNPSPLPPPGATLTLPTVAPLTPGTQATLFKYDPATGTLTNTGIIGGVDVGGTTATFFGVTNFSTFVGFLPAPPAPPAVTPFARFTAKLELEQRELDLKATFTLGAGSDGIHPTTEAVTIEIGGAPLTIPAGAFREDKHGRFKFEGRVGGAKVEAMIRPLGGGSYEFKAEGRLATPGARGPVSIVLTIGNDSGATTVRAKRD